MMLTEKDMLSILAAVVAMIVGAVVYLVDRPADTVYLFYLFELDTNLTQSVFGTLGQWLPTSLHIYTFTLLTALIWGLKRKTILVSGLLWLLIEVLFEFGQLPGVATAVAGWIPAAFSGIPILENLAAYFIQGTFDPLDLVAALAGCLSAWLTFELIENLGVTPCNK